MKKKLTLLAVGGLVALGLASPAGAADPVYHLTGPNSLSLPPVSESGQAYPRALAVLSPDLPYGKRTVTLTVDTSKLAGIATVAINGDPSQNKCTSDATTLTCVSASADLDLSVTPVKGGKVGDAGDLTFSAKTEGATFAPHSTRVVVGGPELNIESGSPFALSAVGNQSRLPIAFKNRGLIATKDPVVWMRTTRGIDTLEKYDNCTYGPAGDSQADKGSTLTICTLEGTAEGGQTYETVEPLTLKANTRAMNEVVSAQIFEAGEAPKPRGEQTRPSTGKKLTFKPRTSPGGSYDDDLVKHAFTVKNTADIVAVGSTVKGKAGETVTLDVGYHNRGPAAIADEHTEVVNVGVEIPAGATVTNVPPRCSKVDATRYTCGSGETVLDDEKGIFRFELKIDKVVEGAKGFVRVGSGQGENEPHSWDPDHANNTADIVLNPKDPGPGTTPTSSATTSAAPTTPAPPGTTTPTAPASSTAPASGGLASTGTSALATAVGAAAVLAAGIVLFVVFRPRRGNHA
ncbi:hypothetical protein [Streptomyces sp. NPDC096339]|uniref:hypothetical protein n=1 Tax=Streptomyces sp. NPDC096339 TaxID=3366086 RepID=UPI003802F4B7